MNILIYFLSRVPKGIQIQFLQLAICVYSNKKYNHQFSNGN